MDELKRLRSTDISPEALAPSIRQLFEDAQRNEQVLRRYQAFELALLSAERLDELMATLLRTSRKIFHLAAVELWLHDPQHTLGELLPEDDLADVAVVLHGNDRSFKRLFPEPVTVRLVSTQDGASLPVFKGKDVRSAALLPLYRKGTFVGSMHLGAREAQRFTRDKSTDFITHMASVVTVCIENALVQEQLRHLSLLDPLTKAQNRRGFQLGLETEISRASRSRDPLSLLFVDLDHFKSINDKYGHPAGDRVLRVVAQVFREKLRRFDHVCRYGGEEFALVLPRCDREQALKIAERLRGQVSQMEIGICDDDPARPISVTLSIGVCCWQPVRRADDAEQAKLASALIRCSDQGVYQSKDKGRNAVTFVPLHGD